MEDVPGGFREDDPGGAFAASVAASWLSAVWPGAVPAAAPGFASVEAGPSDVRPPGLKYHDSSGSGLRRQPFHGSYLLLWEAPLIFGKTSGRTGRCLRTLLPSQL